MKELSRMYMFKVINPIHPMHLITPMKTNIIIIFIVCVLFCGAPIFSQEATDTAPNARKYRFEFALGMTRSNPQCLYTRGPGLEQWIGQYADYYHLTSSTTGSFKESKLFIPFNLSLQYQLKQKFFLRAGIDYSFSSASSAKVFQVVWTGFSESHDYAIKDRISYVMPHVGAGFNTHSFDLYGAIGLGFVRYKNTETLHYSEPGYNNNIQETFDATATAPGFILGVKYQLPVSQKITGKTLRLFVKLEALLLKVGTLKGSKTRTASNSLNQHSTETVTGTYYQYDWNPYGGQTIPYWDVYETLPDTTGIYNPSKLSPNLSGIRLLLGISF